MSKYNICRCRYGCLLFLFLFLVAFNVWANTGAKTEVIGQAPEYSSRTLLETINNTVVSETAHLEELKSKLKQQQTLEKAALIEIDAYNIQNIVHNNLLLQPAASITSLERAYDDNKLVLKSISDKIKELIKRRDNNTELQKQTQNQINLSNNQSAETKSSGWSTSEKSAMSSALGRLDLTLKEKQRALVSLIGGLDNLINQFNTIKASVSNLNSKIETEIERRQTKALFDRNQVLPKVFEKGALREEIVAMAANLRKPFKKDILILEGRRLQEATPVSLLLLIFLTTIAVIFVKQLRRFYLDYEKKHAIIETHRWRLLATKLIRRSLVLIGILFVLYCYDLFKIFHYRFPFHRPVFNILLVILFTRWLIDYLKVRKPGATLFIPENITAKIVRLTITVRYFAIVYIIIQTSAVENGFFLFIGRLFIEIYLVACCIAFWRAIKNANRHSGEVYPKSNGFSYTLWMFLTYLITLGGLAIEMAGFSVFALYWLLSWARSLAVLFWASIIFKAIMEWRGELFPETTSDDEEPATPIYPVERIYISLGWLLWFCGLIVTLMLAWNTKQNNFDGIYAMLNQSFSVGKVGLNVLDVLVAILILFLTIILTRLGRYIIQQKIFHQSELEPGLQASITTIAIYLIWGLGVILALSIIGFSTTSLAVAFGALGIGLGFGLQAIFNNFISGIILLFERPIQVGDEVEINGVWSTVKKINVRATVVQTYDNASLIIPNSEFISSVVKNWSFSDKRLRREIDVGVAYGSDVELVRNTLLDIAAQSPRIFKRPKPEVVFADFGDSALIFRLRVWTDLDHMIKVPTEIRFEIDRRFRELGIEIAFPQRDIHIRSVNGNDKIELTPELEK